MSSATRVTIGITGTLLAAFLAPWLLADAFNGVASGILIAALMIVGIVCTGIWARKPPSVRL